MTSSASQKSAEAFRTISEVADALKLPQHVLRFWETRFSQIKPLKRAGGRRFYRPADVELLAAIRLLLYSEGYTIKGVQRLLRERGPRAVAALLERRELPSETQPREQAGHDDAPASDDTSNSPPVDFDGDIEATLRYVLAELAACRLILATAAEA